VNDRFADHFSACATGYARFRPRYPDTLFRWLAGLAPSTDLAWDCATGSGQAAVGLAVHFDRVVATDVSARQLAAAQPRDNVEYRVAPAEASGLSPQSVSLITVAQALHWFAGPRFWAEARRVAKPGAVLACWCYELFSVNPAIDALVDELYHETLAGCWPPERRHVETGYAEIEFPFKRIEAPAFEMTAEWTAEQLVGYLGTWSAVARYRAARGVDPMARFKALLEDRSLEPLLPVRWPLKMLVGRLEDSRP
jgi:SAM-dependent methyltransferase